MMRVGAHWHLLLPALCLGSLAPAASETCQQEQHAQQCEDYGKDQSGVQFLQKEKSHTLDEEMSHRFAEETRVPGFLPDIVVDLDLAPRDRFRAWAREQASRRGPDDPAVLVGLDGIRHDVLMQWMDTVMSPQEQEEWVEVLKGSICSEYLEELAGVEEEFAIAEQAYGRPLPYPTKMHDLLLACIIYELNYPTIACTGVLVALPNGTVIHGRNMDYFVYGIQNANQTQKVTFMRGGKPLYTSVTMNFPMIVHTAMRFGGWSVEVNTHKANNRAVNLAMAKAGGNFSGWTLRHLMETVPDYETALLSIRKTTWAAPHYLVVAGAGPDHGAVLTLHRTEPKTSWAEAGYPQPMIVERRLEPASGVWYMAQTNDEAWEEPEDDRRPFEQAWLMNRGRDNVTAEDVMTLIRTPPARQLMTVFSILMVPATNYSDLVISRHVGL